MKIISLPLALANGFLEVKMALATSKNLTFLKFFQLSTLQLYKRASTLCIINPIEVYAILHGSNGKRDYISQKLLPLFFKS
ncbi:MAG: hypothetical protein EOO96_18465 [Pedobacter sp.]|nr:MAG: hypothetical protein EOO96_18465 [Pedobacter sp.]